MEKYFFEIDERGCAYQLSCFACGIAPCGGEVVYAANKREALELYCQYRAGAKWLKGNLYVQGEPNPYRNIIH